MHHHHVQIRDQEDRNIAFGLLLGALVLMLAVAAFFLWDNYANRDGLLTSVIETHRDAN